MWESVNRLLHHHCCANFCPPQWFVSAVLLQASEKAAVHSRGLTKSVFFGGVCWLLFGPFKRGHVLSNLLFTCINWPSTGLTEVGHRRWLTQQLPRLWDYAITVKFYLQIQIPASLFKNFFCPCLAKRHLLTPTSFLVVYDLYGGLFTEYKHPSGRS